MISFRKNFQNKIFNIIVCLCMVCGLMWAAGMQANAEEHTNNHCVCGGSVTTGGHTHDTAPTWTAWNGTGDITYTDDIAYVYLTDIATRSDVVKVTDGKTLNLCLNGKTLSYGGTVISVEGGATLNICDCKSGGEITSSSGCAIQVTTVDNSNVHTTLNLYGGEINDGNTSNSGAIKLYSNNEESSETVAEFNMYDGKVCDGQNGGCAVYASSSQGYYSINIYGGNIVCESGDGFRFDNNRNVNIKLAGGTITSGCNGVWLDSGNTLTLSGNPKFVEHNWAISRASINIPRDGILTVTDGFAPADNTTITVKKLLLDASSVEIAAPEAGGSTLSSKAQYFTSAEEGYFVECKDGKLYLSTCAITEQPSKDNDYTITASGSSDTSKVKYQWYSAIKGNVAVTSRNVSKDDGCCFYGYQGVWHPAYQAGSTEQVKLKAFTIHMTRGDVLTISYQEESGSAAQGKFDSFELKEGDKPISGTEKTKNSCRTRTFTAPSDGDYTLWATATPASHYEDSEQETYYNLGCNFSATVSAYVAEGEGLNGQTAASLNTKGLAEGRYLCAVTWEDKTTIYSDAVDTSIYIANGSEYTVSSDTEWTNQDFVVTAAESWQVSTTNTASGAWENTLTCSDETSNGSLSFYVKNANTGIISEVITKSYKIDKTAPVITGAENGKTYCTAAALTITDDNLDTVKLNGEEATLTDSKLTINPASGKQTVTATDKAGNSKTVTITVNDGHTWDSGAVTKEATYASKGEKTYTCTVCKATKTEEIARKTGSSGSSSTAAKTDSVTNTTEEKKSETSEGASKTTVATTTATVKAKTTTEPSGTTTTAAAVDEATAIKIIEKALENKSEEVVINSATAAALAETAAGSATEIALPEKTVQELSEKTEASVTIKSDAAEVTLNKAAVDGLAAQAGDDGYVKLVVETVKQEPKLQEVELKLVTSKGVVTDFRGGNVSITVKLNNSLATEELTCVYISDGGIYHKVNGTKNTNGTYTFITGHFSSYAIMALDEADKVISEQTAKVKDLASKIQIKARSVKTKKGNIKVTLKITKGAASFKALKDMGYTLKYQYYRSTVMKKNYKAKFETLGKPYTNTDAKKGTRYYYKARIVVYDEEGSLVTKTDLKKCWYATRIR